MMVGAGDFTYEQHRYWGELPSDLPVKEFAGVAVDARDRVYVLARAEVPVLVFDGDGSFLTAWGAGVFTRPHSITITPDDLIYCTDDLGHAVHKFTLDGTFLSTTRTTGGHPSDTGYVLNRPETVTRSGPPFNRPTAVAVAPSGELYITDGYGNARVHRFSSDGELIASWGEPGGGPGEFRTPHGIYISGGGLVYVADRGNSRVQVFSLEGDFRGQWSDVHFPNTLRPDASGYVYVAELGGVYLGWPEVRMEAPPARITVRDGDGHILCSWDDGGAIKQRHFFCPHGIAVDSRGNIYVAEVPVTYTHGQAPPDWPLLRKYTRV